MKNSYRRKINSSITIMSIGVFVGFLYPLLSRELDDPYRVLNGILIGFLGSGFIVLNEVWIRRMVIRRLKFSNLIILKSLQYASFFILLITVIISLDRARRYQMGLLEYWQSNHFVQLVWYEDFFIIITYALVITVIFILVYLTSKKMGQGILWNFIIGRYHTPSSQERIFMYLDINNSTAIAEELGDVKYHLLLNQFFFDITDSIVLNYGRIYRYIGDEVIISWSLKNGLRKTNFLNAYLAAKHQIEKKSEEYQQTYGVVPNFSAAIHCGEVMIGELGEVKSEISYIGEVLQQTAAIEKACSTLGTPLLVSRKLFNLIPPLPELNIIGEHQVNTKSNGSIETVALAVAGK